MSGRKEHEARLPDGSSILLVPAVVEGRMWDLANTLKDLADSFEDDAKNVAELEVDWMRERAKFRLMERIKPGTGPGGRKTNDEVDDAALKRFGDKYEAFMLADAAYKAKKDAVFTLRDVAAVLQSINANLRDQT